MSPNAGSAQRYIAFSEVSEPAVKRHQGYRNGRIERVRTDEDEVDLEALEGASADLSLGRTSRSSLETCGRVDRDIEAVGDGQDDLSSETLVVNQAVCRLRHQQ